MSKGNRIKSVKKNKWAAHCSLHVVLIAGAICFVLPFAWMVLTSLKSLPETTQVPPPIFPAVLRWENYRELFTKLPFLLYYRNTLVMTLGRIGGQALLCSLAAYAFARIRFPGREILFLLMLSGMMIPGYVLLLPQYLIMKDLHWLNSLQALIVPGLFSAFGTFLLRQYFLTLPRELDEAAKIDGANHLQILWHVLLPLSKPALIALMIFTALSSWNDLIWPLIVNNAPQMLTLSVGLAALRGEFSTDFPLLMAGAVLASWPMILLFIVLQRYFIAGIAFTGTKA